MNLGARNLRITWKNFVLSFVRISYKRIFHHQKHKIWLPSVVNQLLTSSFSWYRYARKKRVDESENLTLDSIRHSLLRQEDSIIFSLLERAQYSYNANTYDHDAFSVDGFHGSLVEFMVRETEKLQAQVISFPREKKTVQKIKLQCHKFSKLLPCEN